jgi:hypothetical protein
MANYFETGFGYLVDNTSTTTCDDCPYKSESEFAGGLNLTKQFVWMERCKFSNFEEKAGILLTA